MRLIVKFSWICGFPFCIAVMAHSQAVNVRGKITGASNAPVANATVELLKGKQKTTSGADGAYVLTGSTSVFRSEDGSLEKFRLEHGALHLHLVETSPIRIEIFDAKGNLLDRALLENVGAGSYRFDLAGRVPANRNAIVKASIGKESKSFPFHAPNQAANHTPSQAAGKDAARTNAAAAITSVTSFASAASNPAGALAKASAVVDTLKVSASGFPVKNVPITSYDTTVDVALGGGNDRWGGPGNPAGPSAGCGKPLGALKSGKTTITTGGVQREFIIDIPADYKPGNPYRLFFCFHWYGGSDDSIASGQVEFGRGGGPANYAYYGLKPLAAQANDPAIFIAPQGLNNGWGGAEKDHAFFDDMLALAKGNLCIDTTRVFATGFSFGSMFSYSLSTNHQKQLRAAVGIAPANWNIWLPTPLSREPIAWMQTTGLSDESCKWINDASKELGAKFIGLQRGKDNGCAAAADIPTTTVGSKTHSCYDFAGCRPGYPVKVCTFDGAHIANVGDGGTSNVGKDSWIPKESWKFFTQF
jgi:poly(3-hydroxybutyrate) depolymerase